MYCTLYCVLYLTVLYYILCTSFILYCSELYCTILYCTVLYCTVVNFTVCTSLLYSILCTIQYCAILFCTILYCTGVALEENRANHLCWKTSDGVFLIGGSASTTDRKVELVKQNGDNTEAKDDVPYSVQ